MAHFLQIMSPLDEVCQEIQNIMMEGQVYLLPILSGTDCVAATAWCARGGISYIPLLPVDPLQVLEGHSISSYRTNSAICIQAFPSTCYSRVRY